MDADELVDQRVHDIVAQSIAGLDPADREERIAFCRTNNLHGVTGYIDHGDVAFWWGGRPLCTVDRFVFSDEGLKEPLTHMFVPESPDDASELL